jgi:hypothetical protein
VDSLKEKLEQFPAGSTFEFEYDFSARDQKELVEISDFLRAHGCQVSNPQHWGFGVEEAWNNPPPYFGKVLIR